MRYYAGATLLETMLVLAIASTLTMVGINIYQQFQRDADIYSLKYNIDTLFQAMSNYYYANCNVGAFVTATGKMAVSVDTLINDGYLSRELRPVDAIIGTGTSTSRYMLQFNPATQEYKVRGTVLGTVAVWSMQITINPPPAYYGKLLNSDCLTSASAAGSFNYSCREATATSPTRPSWERMISNVESSPTSTGYWTTTPIVKMFKYRVSPPAAGVNYPCGG